MAELPIYFGDPESSLKAATIFPSDPEKARIFAAWLLVRLIAGGPAPGADQWRASDWETFFTISCAASEFPALYGEALQNFRAGARVSSIMSALWGFICDAWRSGNWHQASWELAVRAVEKRLGQQNLSGSRTSLWRDLDRFKPVLHVLGTRAILNRMQGPPTLEGVINFSGASDPAVGYSRATDVRFFVFEVRMLQVSLLAWNNRRPAKSNRLDEMLEFTDQEWWLSERQPNWPKRLRITHLELGQEITSDQQFRKRRPGRKPKYPSK